MLSWFRQLDDARSAAEVVSITRDYFAMWTPQEIARLPDPCRPPHLRDATDIEELHRATVDAYRASRATGDELTLLQKLTSVIVRASMRLAQLRDEDGDAADDPQRPRQSPNKPAASRNQ
jgi:hypothetical protein